MINWKITLCLAIILIVTLFNHHLVPSVLAAECDPPCRNGGVCDTKTGQCQCPIYWKQHTDCTVKGCGLGTGPDANNTCNCAGTGFNERNCLACESDHACNVYHNFTMKPNSTDSWHCSKNLIPVKSKRFFCGIDGDVGSMLTGEHAVFECDRIYEKRNFTAGTQNHCYLQSYTRKMPGAEGYDTQALDCTLTGCYFYLYYNNDNVQMARYHCLNTSCRCDLKEEGPHNPNGPYCLNDFIGNQLPRMKGWAHVDCYLQGDKANQCTLEQEDIEILQINIPMSGCKGRECYFNEAPQPVPEPREQRLWWIGLVIAGIVAGIILVLFVLSLGCSIIHYHVIKNEHRAIGNEHYGAKLHFKDVSYFLKTSWFGKTQQLLHNISHTIYPGQVVALMGPSGAGKTTLLDILANRNKAGQITGTRLLNDRKYGKDFNRIAAYVSQDDCLMGTLTVYESLLFAARVKLPACIPMKEKKNRVKQVMFDLKISHIKNRRIGDKLHRGISGGERRRVAIAMELIGNPHILFLDEPTSGLDAASAFTVMHSLVVLAKKYNKTIIFSIHQPRTNIFAEFDELLLLSQGKIKYIGPAAEAADYFRGKGIDVPETGNMADHLIDIIVDAETSGRDLTYVPKYSSYGAIDEPVSFSSNTAGKSRRKYTDNAPLLGEAAEHYYDGRLTPYPTSFMTQLWALSLRALTNVRRNFFLFPAHFGSSILIGLVLGVLYWGQGNNFESVQNRLGAIFFILTVLSFTSMSALELFTSERAIYVGERANGYYHAISYFTTKVMFDIIPLRIFPALILGSICYYMINFRNEWEHFAYFLLVLVLFNIASSSLCIAVAAVSPSVAAANIVSIVLILGSAVFGGFLMNRTAMPEWISWVRWLSLYNYSFEVLAVNDLWGFQVLLDPIGFKEAHIPPINVKGQFILNSLGLSNTWFYFDIAMLSLWALGLLGLSAALLIFFVREKR